jgi:HSP20 family protein
MALVKWEPFSGLSSLRQEMERLFGDFEEAVARGMSSRWERTFAPAVEVADTQEAVVVRVQVPGVSKDNLHVDITEHALTLRGEMKEEEKKDEKNYYRQEIRYGAFTRTIPLPMAVKVDQATAQLKDGLLEVTLPKSEVTKAKEIPIKAS